MVQKFVWNTWEACLESAKLPTWYEQKHNIKATKTFLLINEEDIKVAIVLKSDDSHTLVVVIRKAINKDLWMNIIPSDTQLNVFHRLFDLYKWIDEHNEKSRNAKGDTNARK